MRVLIIGAAGLVGNACYRILAADKNIDVVGTYRNYQSSTFDLVHFDPLKKESISLLLKKWDVIIHTGALTNVDLCEQEPDRSYDETVLSTRLILNEVTKHNPNASFIYISTDYVFDGKCGPYNEHAQTNPINVYGKHKLEAETLVCDEIKNYAIIRVTNVYGEEERNKNFISRLLVQLKQNEPFTVKTPVDQFATPVNAIDIARIVKLIINKKATGIFHAAGNDYYNRYQLLLKVLAYFPGHKVSIISVSTKDMAQAANRPLRGGLLNLELYKLDPDFVFSNIDDFVRKFLKDGI